MRFNVMGDLFLLKDWIATHNATITEKYAVDDWEVEIDDDDEEIFCDLCEKCEIECNLV